MTERQILEHQTTEHQTTKCQIQQNTECRMLNAKRRTPNVLYNPGPDSLPQALGDQPRPDWAHG
jgi:hypothetical protein